MHVEQITEGQFIGILYTEGECILAYTRAFAHTRAFRGTHLSSADVHDVGLLSWKSINCFQQLLYRTMIMQGRDETRSCLEFTRREL